MLEIETKYRLDDRQRLVDHLDELGAHSATAQTHSDTYFKHPSRDFVATKEALRIRCIDSVASVTYKGPKLDVGDSMLKARKEIEWCLAPGDADGSQMMELLTALGFRRVTTVHKQRVSYQWSDPSSEYHGFTLTIDDVDQVGLFAEIELLVVSDESDQIQIAGERINALATRLNLTQAVAESYLQLLLNQIEKR